MLQKQTSIYEILLLAGIVTALTIGTAAAYPIWDDRRLLFLVEQNGIQAIQWSFGIRPLAASITDSCCLPHWFSTGWVGSAWDW